jgi:VWFA-related protein
VTENKGRNVSDLKKEDFAVWEDKKPQEIVSFRTVKDPMTMPTGVGLVIDVSLSMKIDDKFGQTRTNVDFLLSKIMKKDDEAYFVEFASDTRLVQPWTTDRKAIIDAIRRVKFREGTAIYDGIMAALPISAAGKQKKQVMLVITDGQDLNSGTLRNVVADAARASDVILYALVIDSEGKGDTSLRQAAAELRQVTDPTGGRTMYVQGFTEFEEAISQLSKEITQQYEVGFIRGSADKQLHEIVVGVKNRKDIAIRHRRVYMAD